MSDETKLCECSHAYEYHWPIDGGCGVPTEGGEMCSCPSFKEAEA